MRWPAVLAQQQAGPGGQTFSRPRTLYWLRKRQTMIATVNGKTKAHSPAFLSPQARQDQLADILRELRRRFGDGVIIL
jgi:hypothetical protein